jgi:hypothetical protein
MVDGDPVPSAADAAAGREEAGRHASGGEPDGLVTRRCKKHLRSFIGAAFPPRLSSCPVATLAPPGATSVSLWLTDITTPRWRSGE